MTKQARTKEEVIARLQELNAEDKIAAHSEADRLLLDSLLIAGMYDVVVAYQTARDEIGFFYA